MLILLAVFALEDAVEVASTPHDPWIITPIKHLIVIFQKNVSFEHYFATHANTVNTNVLTFSPQRLPPASASMLGKTD